jgi:hypothetical protein
MKSLITLVLLVSTIGCGVPRTAPTLHSGDRFPSVLGESLEKKEVRLPEDFSGRVTVLLVAYKQEAQFDVDRWILGMLQLNTPAKIVEVPTIAGMMPRVVQGFINDGMRSGIPAEDWNSVVTVFGDAGKIVSVLGNEHPKRCYAVVLDKQGKILKVFDRGYSAALVTELDSVVRQQL